MVSVLECTGTGSAYTYTTRAACCRHRGIGTSVPFYACCMADIQDTGHVIPILTHRRDMRKYIVVILSVLMY